VENANELENSRFYLWQMLKSWSSEVSPLQNFCNLKTEAAVSSEMLVYPK